jgi:hypothetical protein
MRNDLPQLLSETASGSSPTAPKSLVQTAKAEPRKRPEGVWPKPLLSFLKIAEKIACAVCRKEKEVRWVHLKTWRSRTIKLRRKCYENKSYDKRHEV